MKEKKNRGVVITAFSVIFLLQIMIASGIASAEETGIDPLKRDKNVNSTFDDVVVSNNLLDRLDITDDGNKNGEFDTSTRTVKLSSDESFEKTVSECIISSKNNFRGPGLEIRDSSVTVFDLIPDSDISNPDYLEREKGIIIYLNYSSGYLNNLQRTLWAYEIDATSIVKEIFTCGIEKKTGFIIISMTDLDEAVNPIKFKLTASDAQKYSESINDGLYLQMKDWSDVGLSPESNLILYEDPDTRISSYGETNNDNDGGTQNILSESEIKEKISERTRYLNLLSQKIFDLCLENNWEEASVISEELIADSLKYIEEADEFALSSDAVAIKDEYVKCLESYSDAGMCFWYGTTFFDEEKIEEGQTCLRKSIGDVNKIFESSDAGHVDENKVIRAPAISLLPKAKRMTEVYKYMDPSGCNDISIKIERSGYRESYWVKNDNSVFPVIADFDKKFFYVVVDVTHMGYRGGETSRIKTPDNSDFTLYYMGDKYKDSTPDEYIRSLGVPYSKVTLGRKEHLEAILIYEVPLEFKKEDAYIEVDLGENRIPVWCFKLPENSSLWGD